MAEQLDAVIERVKVREVAGIFRSRDALDDAVQDLLHAGFDRADIDLMADIETVRRTLGTVYVPAEELPDVPGVPRRAYVAREDVTIPVAGVAGILTYIGATAAALGVVASGGALAAAAAAAALGGVAGGGLGAVLARMIGRREAKELETLLAEGGLVLWVRVHTPEREAEAQEILRKHGAEAVRVHEMTIDKRLEDLPLHNIRDPWLGGEPLGQL